MCNIVFINAFNSWNLVQRTYADDKETFHRYTLKKRSCWTNTHNCFILRTTFAFDIWNISLWLLFKLSDYILFKVIPSYYAAVRKKFVSSIIPVLLLRILFFYFLSTVHMDNWFGYTVSSCIFEMLIPEYIVNVKYMSWS